MTALKTNPVCITMYKLQKRKGMSQTMEIALIVGIVIAVVAVLALSVSGGAQTLLQRASITVNHQELVKTSNGTYYLTIDAKDDGNKRLSNVTVQVQDSVPYSLLPNPIMAGQSASYQGKVVPAPANPTSGSQIPLIVKGTADDGSIASKTVLVTAP